jgi:hypothetical protein
MVLTKEQMQDVHILRHLKAGRTVYITKPGGFLEKHYVDSQGYQASKLIPPAFDRAAVAFLNKLTDKDSKHGSKARRFIPQA